MKKDGDIFAIILSFVSSDEFEFYGNHLKCRTLNDGNDCNRLTNTLKTVTNSGKCHTFFYSHNDNDNQDYFIDMIDLDLFYYQLSNDEPFYMKTTLTFHSPKSLPILNENQLTISDFKIGIFFYYTYYFILLHL